MSRVIEALLSLLEIIVDNPRLFLIVLGILAMLTGWAFGASWIIALGFLFLVFGIITEKGRGEPARSPVHGKGIRTWQPGIGSNIGLNYRG